MAPVPPVINAVEKKSRVFAYQAYSQFRFHCRVIVYPLGNLRFDWRKDNLSIKMEQGKLYIGSKPLHGRIRFENTTFSMDTLMIDLVEQADRALYSCHVSNEFGTTQDYLYLRVKGKYLRRCYINGAYTMH
ncbi:unnamed protein product [Protopolystoma xenopodis]|uniref:Ig-like domain-containing protein n=1 Tax=Protopolystoma xenopodis TaxID=117903 RepID=A0A3S5AK45_9PLAT|nr:unnamed protein product [Protopolystoma xenopodis]